MSEKPDSTNVFHHFREVKNKTWLDWEKSFSEEYKEYRRKWVEYPKSLHVPNAPLHLDIEITNKCNLKCTFCARTVSIEDETFRTVQNMDISLYKKVIDNAIKVGVYAVNLNFLGEPMLHPQIMDVIRYTKDSGILDVFLHTNGTVLTEKKCHSLIKAGLDKLSVSFDSPYEEKYNEVRVGAKYERVLNNIKTFSRIKNELQLVKPLTRINFINLPGTTEQEINDMIDLFSPLVDSIGILEYVDPFKYSKKTFDDGYISKFVCPQILTRLMVYADGNVHPCCSDYTNELVLGTLTTQTIEDIWNSKKLNYIRKKHLEGKFYEIPACAKCEFAIDGDTNSRIVNPDFETIA